MPPNPRLQPASRVLVRADGTVHVGPDPAEGIRLSGLDGPERSLLRLLDGTHRRDQFVAEGRRRGVPAERSDRLLGVLSDARLLVSAPAGRRDHAGLPGWYRDPCDGEATALGWVGRDGRDGYSVLADRRGRRVAVLGRGAVAGGVAAALLRAGVGEVEQGIHVRAALEVDTATGAPAARPDVVVHVSAAPADPVGLHEWHRARVTVLPVGITHTKCTVGPLLVPGDGPCAECLELTRSDLDPSWPLVRAQLRADAAGGRADEPRGETSMRALAVGLASAVVLGHLDERDLPPGGALDARLPWPAVKERLWPPHPRCTWGVDERPCTVSADRATSAPTSAPQERQEGGSGTPGPPSGRMTV
jgi:hypothetical protein